VNLGKLPSLNEQHFRCAQTKNVFIFFSRTCTTTTTPAFENDDGFDFFELFFLSVRLRAVVLFKEGITFILSKVSSVCVDGFVAFFFFFSFPSSNVLRYLLRVADVVLGRSIG
jgi:hypothetical protein